MKAQFLVRAILSDVNDKDEFDLWYERTHLPQAMDVLKPARVRRGWSELEPNVHYVLMELEDLEVLKARLSSDDMKAVSADFDRSWGASVTRTRDVLRVVQTHS